MLAERSTRVRLHKGHREQAGEKGEHIDVHKRRGVHTWEYTYADAHVWTYACGHTCTDVQMYA
jgi:hypothetical protein